ncbi:MAG TPA: DUF3786 domain-containing protein [bacterium]|nr:DUF3786 domain-containing protein [bacterium]
MFQTNGEPWKEKLWKELRSLKPEEVCVRAAVRYEQAFYSVLFMDREYRVYPEEVRVKGDFLAADPEFRLLLITYLVSAKDLLPDGTWLSEKSLKGGSIFFQGPHRLPGGPILERFGRNPEMFLYVGEALGGKRINYGDAALEFRALPRVPLACVLWAADEEFPAGVNFLFDPTIESHFPLDVILALVHSVVRRLVESEGN